MNPQSHRSDPRVLNRRTLERDQRVLAAMLRPGMAVLDVGCGSGAITAGIARAVGRTGRVVGLDRDESLVNIARLEYGAVPSLSFERGDVTALEIEGEFDIVTAARALQWMSDPALALERMRNAARPGGSVVVLDYNHRRNSWAPQPPAPFTRFYDAFLAWRAANGWDNEIADHVPELFHAAGLAEIRTHSSDETVVRGDAEFSEACAIWAHVIASIGERIVAAGFLREEDCTGARDAYRQYQEMALEKQTLSLRSVVGRKTTA